MPRYIDADALLEFANNHVGGVIDCNDIARFPTIEAEPVRHGTWIGIEYDGYADGCPVYDLWECSECKHEHKGEEDTLTDYCPDCGAKMDGGADNAKAD